jgi:hypothetical protein
MTQRDQIAASIWPHLAGDRPAPSEQPRAASALAASMWPSLAPKKPPKVRVGLTNNQTTEATRYGAGYTGYQEALRWRRR